MKKIKQLAKISLIALVFTFASCSSDSDGGSVKAGDGTITAKIDGKSFSSMKLATALQIANNMFTLTGSNSKGENISIQIVSYNGVGTYNISDNIDSFGIGSFTAVDLNNPQNTNNVWSAPYENSGNVGSIEITEVTDTHVKGTFAFKAKNKSGTFKNITAGSFNAKKMN